MDRQRTEFLNCTWIGPIENCRSAMKYTGWPCAIYSHTLNCYKDEVGGGETLYDVWCPWKGMVKKLTPHSFELLLNSEVNFNMTYILVRVPKYTRFWAGKEHHIACSIPYAQCFSRSFLPSNFYMCLPFPKSPCALHPGMWSPAMNLVSFIVFF